MTKNDDLCWLPTEPLPGIPGYFLPGEGIGAIETAIRTEMTESFRALPVPREAAELIFQIRGEMEPEQYAIAQSRGRCRITAGGGPGLLYGLYGLIRRRMLAPDEGDFSLEDGPVNRLRMINHWDRLSGEVERGYSGRSLLYEGLGFIAADERLRNYARLLASVGINALSLNNVNVSLSDTMLIYPEGLVRVKRYCEIFRQYGISTFFSVNFATPVIRGELETADPCDPRVRAWWAHRVAEIYREIPDFGGFLVKADSEGEPGPHSYGRDHAQGANLFAHALAPYGGMVIWRCFVYDCRQDWRDRSIDRARAAYEHFKPLDGRFAENVTLQIKFGPMDFQIREPVSPLIGALEQTRYLVEFQITQEYTGQQRHICYLPVQWEEVLGFDTHVPAEGSRVGALTGGKAGCGLAAVGSVGRDDNWTGHKLAQANWYGFGRMAWAPRLTAGELLREWIGLSFALPAEREQRLYEIMIQSRKVYEDYTVPLGVGFMCKPGVHYGPDVDGYEYDRWGTYHFADRWGVGNNRSQKDGTGYTGLYRQPNARLYEDLQCCPDELLLFFHHVPYTHRLQSGKTVIQHIYDSHFEGCRQVQVMQETWETFEGLVPQRDFENVRERLREQSRCAREWRDQVNTYFWRKSGIPDKHHRQIYP